MKACQAGHLSTVKLLLSKNVDINKVSANNEYTPLSLACVKGHLAVVELLLGNAANPFYKVKDNSTMVIEAAKGGYTSVVKLLLDNQYSMIFTPPVPAIPAQEIPADESTLTEVQVMSQPHDIAGGLLETYGCSNAQHNVNSSIQKTIISKAKPNASNNSSCGQCQVNFYS